MNALAENVRDRKSHIWERDPDGWYIEPSWTSERLFQAEPMWGLTLDPACGLGTICAAADRAGLLACGSDLRARSLWAVPSADFLTSNPTPVGNIVCNPPFKHARAFVERALERAERKVCMLLPLAWMSGVSRSKWLETTPLRRVWVLAPRPSMPPGAVIQAGEDPGGGTKDFAWFVWRQGYRGACELRWLRRDG